jgi:peptidoglycan/LPS O-acetylase OafA/YrhL
LASRWIARVLSIVVVGIIVAFLGEGTPKPKEWLLIAFFPIGLLGGFVLAWWREITGALISIGSMAVFYVVCYTLSGKFPTGHYFAILASPAALFLVAGVLARGGSRCEPGARGHA